MAKSFALSSSITREETRNESPNWGLALFLVRFFSLTAWGEYGVGIVTVALTGVALSGASQFLFYVFFQRSRSAILFWLPFVLLFVSALAFQLIAVNRFNPYLMQQGGLWPGQALNLFYCYLALMPVFFLAGLFLGLSFLDLAGDIPQATVFHLLGSAAGLLLIFVCQSFIHPFHLLAVLLPVLALAPLGRSLSKLYVNFSSVFTAAFTCFCQSAASMVNLMLALIAVLNNSYKFVAFHLQRRDFGG